MDETGVDKLRKGAGEDTDAELKRKLTKVKLNNTFEAWKDHTWDFKHWMTVGEMPNTFGFGLHTIDYYKLLEKRDRKSFDDDTVAMRSATTITRNLEKYEPQKILVDLLIYQEDMRFEGNRRGYLSLRPDHLSAILEQSQITKYAKQGGTGIPEGSTAINELDEKVQNVKAPATKINSASDEQARKDELKKHQKMFVEYSKYAQALWNETANLGDASEETQTVAEGITNKLNPAMKEYDKDPYHLGAFGKGVNETKIFLRRTIGEIARAWGDATAAMGYHPFKYKPIETSVSTTVHAYQGYNDKKTETGNSGEKALNDFIEKLNASDVVTWTDMDASGAMWSKAANFDRYRDTKVLLFLSNNPKLNDVGKADYECKVTFQELQLSIIPALALTLENLQSGSDKRRFKRAKTKDINEAAQTFKTLKLKTAAEATKKIEEEGLRGYMRTVEDLPTQTDWRDQEIELNEVHGYGTELKKD
jgi:hypothetical protein